MIDYARAGQATVVVVLILAAIYWLMSKAHDEEDALYENDDTHWI